MIIAAPHLILPPERPALVRAADLKGLPSWQEMERRERAVREGMLPFPVFCPAVGGISVVPIGSAANNSGGTVTISGVNVPAGALIVAATIDSGATPPSLSDGGTNSYTQDNQNTAQIGSWSMFYCANCSALSGATLTFTKSAAGDGAFAAFYATGILAASPLDTAVTQKNNGATVTSTSPTITSGTPAQAGELFVGISWFNVTASVGFTQDSGNGWSTSPAAVQATAGNNDGLCFGYQVNAGSGTKTFNPTLSPAARWAISTYGFKHA